jgi:hypothetical protein
MGTLLAKKVDECRFFYFFVSLIYLIFLVGCEVWTWFSRLIQSYRLRQYGTDTESPQCCSILRDRYTIDLLSVSIWIYAHENCKLTVGRRYTYTSPSHLISRLTSRNMHLLALRISTYLSLKPDAVLKHWASAKILRSRPTATGTGADADVGGDDEVCKLIVDKFKELGGADVSYAEIAKRAWEAGRIGLATKVHLPFLIRLSRFH